MLNIDFDKLLDILAYQPKSPTIFSSGLFLFLFTAFIVLYYTLRKQQDVRIVYVTLFSYFFYYKSSGLYFMVLFLVSTIDFVLAQKIASAQKKQNKKMLLVLSISINLGVLCFFKYTNFFYELICDINNLTFNPLNIFLPVGISFFTFQSMSYTLDIYRNQLKPLYNFLDYAFFVSFFPQLVAGPIVRARDFIPQIRRPLLITSEMFNRGIYLIIIGLFKKAIISDYISANFVDRIFDNPTLYTGIENLFGVYGYALQIYCDFSGYSDMAIGIALLLGFHFNINFDSPYKSANVTEFWRRWHISLSTWLRDYLYISLGGNRKGKIRTYLNQIITMLLGGLWHGPSLRFVFWGGIHGVSLAIHKFLMSIFPTLKVSEANPAPKWRRFLGIIFTFHLVCFGWVFFRAHTFADALSCLSQITTSFHPEIFTQFVSSYSWVLGLMLLGFFLHFAPKKWELFFEDMVGKVPLALKALTLIVLIVLIIQIKSSEIQPFIYFQF